MRTIATRVVTNLIDTSHNFVRRQKIVMGRSFHWVIFRLNSLDLVIEYVLRIILLSILIGIESVFLMSFHMYFTSLSRIHSILEVLICFLGTSYICGMLLLIYRISSLILFHHLPLLFFLRRIVARHATRPILLCYVFIDWPLILAIPSLLIRSCLIFGNFFLLLRLYLIRLIERVLARLTWLHLLNFRLALPSANFWCILICTRVLLGMLGDICMLLCRISDNKLTVLLLFTDLLSCNWRIWLFCHVL